MGQLVLFAGGRNSKPTVPAIRPHKAAVGKVKTI